MAKQINPLDYIKGVDDDPELKTYFQTVDRQKNGIVYLENLASVVFKAKEELNAYQKQNKITDAQLAEVIRVDLPITKQLLEGSVEIALEQYLLALSRLGYRFDVTFQNK